MKHRHLGTSGMLVSEIAYGNWLTHASQITEDAAVACVNAALDAGVTSFDTADVYAGTRAEEVLGRALRGQRREGLEILSKCYWPVGPGLNDRGLSRKHIMEACHGSLRRLGVDYLDLYQAHRYDYATPLEETLRAFDDLVRAGKILYVGVSEWRAEEIRRAQEIATSMGFDRLVSNQPQYSMLHRVIEAEVIPTCVELGMGQLVWSPMAGGILTGKYLPGEPPQPGSRGADEHASGFLRNRMTPEILERVQRLKPLAEAAGLSMPTMAVAWVLGNSNVSSAIVGASRPEQLADTLAASGVELPVDLRAAIDEVLGDAVVADPALTASPAQRP
ncbi:MAG: aldo/keto reductase family protein [Candidatus Nanopelagicales bacterium]